MVKQYVGARYVPKFASPVAWAANTSYEALTIVTFNNASYTSKVPVPPTVGNPANNPQYWALTGNYNAQVEQYRQETETVSNNLKGQITTEITNRKNADTTLQNNIDAEATARRAADNTLQNNIDAEATARRTADNTLQGNIDSETSTRASADASLQVQIDNIIAPSGEAPSAAEVQNARIGADGTIYTSLGTAIRTQVGDLNNATETIAINLLDPTAVTLNKTLLPNDGRETDSDGSFITDYIKCEKDAVYNVVRIKDNVFYKGSAANTNRVCFYNQSKQFIETASEKNGFSCSNDNVAYFRAAFTTSSFYGDTITTSITKNFAPENPNEVIPYFSKYVVAKDNDGKVYLENYIPYNFRTSRQLINAEKYINTIIRKLGNASYTIVLPYGDLHFYNRVKLPYKVSIEAQRGTNIYVHDNVTAFEYNGEDYPYSDIQDSSGGGFNGNGCVFLLYTNSVGIFVNAQNANDTTAFARKSFSNIVFLGKSNNISSIGIKYIPNHVYLVSHYSLIFSNTICVQWGIDGFVCADSGENMQFIACTFTQYPFKLYTYALQINCFGCSFDYCQSIIDKHSDGACSLFLNMCHMERCKKIGGGGTIIIGTGNISSSAGSNDYDNPPIENQMGESSELFLQSSLGTTNYAVDTVINSPYIKFYYPRRIQDLSLNRSTNLCTDGVIDGTLSDEFITAPAMDVTENNDHIHIANNDTESHDLVFDVPVQHYSKGIGGLLKYNASFSPTIAVDVIYNQQSIAQPTRPHLHSSDFQRFRWNVLVTRKGDIYVRITITIPAGETFDYYGQIINELY